ncbi:enoyl-CoA hydratase-related protein [Pseudomonas sp. BF-R-01]|jgi:hypothetical protein|uniref:enoyl-CoA hydratase-related protein n=1 Tax=Pseudomonas sp. BF-R-01 TaxID=2832365 RepID=UPI0021DAD765|nr:enoyl-CoA hydratase-related protein [Pseudomonas sp. BF-R-01]
MHFAQVTICAKCSKTKISFFYQNLFSLCSDVMVKIQSLSVPVVARVQGVATAAGCQLVASCDLAVATFGTRFRVSGINLGIFCSTPSVALRLEKVLEGIESAIAAGFKRLNINSVIQSGVNSDEVYDLAIYALSRGLDINFIEEMPLGIVDSHDRSRALVTSDEVLERLSDNLYLMPVARRTGGSSKYYSVRGYDSRIGFISPHSHNFCSACNRVRVMADGKLVLCLGQNNAIDLKKILRDTSYSRDAMRSIIVDAVKLKQAAHSLECAHGVQVIRFMSITGG